MAAKKKKETPTSWVSRGLTLSSVPSHYTLEAFSLPWAPAKSVVGSRIAIHDASLGSIIGTAKLLGYVHYKKKGKAEIVGELDIERLKISSSLVSKTEPVVWHLSLRVTFDTAIPHPGGLSLWKLRSPALEQVNNEQGTILCPGESHVERDPDALSPEDLDDADEARRDQEETGPAQSLDDVDHFDDEPEPQEEGFYDPVTGEVYETLPSDAERARNEEAEKMDTPQIPWKAKKHYPVGVCAVRECTAPADGHATVISKKTLKYRPICLKHSLEYTTHKPTPLAEIAKQRNGLADLAHVLDTTPEDVWMELDEQGLTERGERRPPPPGTMPLELTSRAAADDGAPRCADCGEPQFKTPHGITCKNGHGGASSIVPADDPEFARSTIVATVPRKKLQAVYAEAQEALKQLTPFYIRDQQGMNIANNVLQATKIQYKEIEGLRKKAVKPINDAKESVQDAFNPALNALVAIEQLLKSRVAEALKRIQAEQDAALQHVQQAYQQGDMRTAALATQHAQAAEIALPQGTSIRQIVDFVVDDIHLVPREFLMINDAAVRHALQAGLIIPGIRKVTHDSVTVRTS